VQKDIERDTENNWKRYEKQYRRTISSKEIQGSNEIDERSN
jgi:hypothetical protein